MGNILGNVLEFILDAAPIIYGIYLHIALIFFLFYKRNYVLNLLDQELEKVKITSNFKGFSQENSKPSYLQHALFILALTALAYWYTTLGWRWLKVVCSLTLIYSFLLYIFWGAFTKVYSSKHIIAAKYLNERWTIGIFLVSSFLTISQIIINILSWIVNSSLFKLLYKLVSYAFIIFVITLIFTLANINRENFSEFCRNIYPPIANSLQEFYQTIDKKLGQ